MKRFFATVTVFLFVTVAILFSFFAQAEEALKGTLMEREAPLHVEEAGSGGALPQNSPIKVTLDGHEYSEDELIWDFTNIAFSSVLPGENTSNPVKSAMYPFKNAFLVKFPEKRETWLSEYKKRSNGLPKSGVINKWSHEVTIALNFPQYKSWGYKIDIPEATSNTFKERLKRIIPEIEAATGLPVHFVEADDPKEQTEQFARVRIIPQSNPYLYNNYKFIHSNDMWGGGHGLTDLERIAGATVFTPYTRAQVDGVLVPNADNTVGTSICYIEMRLLPEKMIKALISECVVRSLGLPEMSKVDDKSVIGHWNAAEDVVSKTVFYDGKSAVRWPEKPIQRQVAETDFLREIDDEPLTEYDEAMISLLYCEAIKPGMDKFSAIEALYSHPECFKKLIKKGER